MGDRTLIESSLKLVACPLFRGDQHAQVSRPVTRAPTQGHVAWATVLRRHSVGEANSMVVLTTVALAHPPFAFLV